MSDPMQPPWKTESRIRFAIGLLGVACFVGLIALSILFFSGMPIEIVTTVFMGMLSSLISSGVVYAALYTRREGLESLLRDTNEACHEMCRPTIRIIDKRVDLPTDEFYERYYATARELQFVGIACNEFVKYLCPSAWDATFSPNDGKGDERVKQLRATKLIRRLTESPIPVTVFLVRPGCDYAHIRDKEEGGRQTIHDDLERVVGALKQMAHDVKQVLERNAGERGIRGRLEFYLIEKNPYASIFMCEMESGGKCMHVGPLLQGRRGDDNPLITIYQEVEGQRVLFDAYFANLVALKEGAYLVFQWQGRSISYFEARHSYSSATGNRVRSAKGRARSRRAR